MRSSPPCKQLPAPVEDAAHVGGVFRLVRPADSADMRFGASYIRRCCVVQGRRIAGGASRVRQALVNVELDGIELRTLAGSDLPNGIAGCGGFFLEAERAVARFARHRRASALLLFEIDHFKDVTDRYGHAAGDLILHGVCTKLARLIRKGDVLGRLGGAEFGILLTEARPGEAVHAAERFRRSIEGFVIDHAAPVRVTASFGVADLSDYFASAEDWRAGTEEALYAARHAGGNRTCTVTNPRAT